MYDFFDYFTGKVLLTSESPEILKVRDLVKIPGFEDILMVYALHSERKEALLAPATGNNKQLSYSFVENKLVCKKCKMNCPLGIFEQKEFKRHGRIWDHGLDLNRTMRVMKLIDETHHVLCDLIHPTIETI